ncbi:MAG: BamA/TamA family outer membrane protein [Burkholderiaceae bacterium]
MRSPARGPSTLVAAFAAAVLALGTGCAALKGEAQAGAAAGTETRPADAGVAVDIDAPAELRDLLQRHLDLARVARLGADDAPDEAEWLRLVAAAPAQARELLQTEGYFAPEVQVRRDGAPTARVHVTVTPGPRARVRELSLQVAGPLRERIDAGDADAQAQFSALRRDWPLPPGAVFRNADWAGAKSSALAVLRAGGYAQPAIRTSRADVDAATAEVTLEVVLDSGPLFLAGALHIEGLERHDDESVRHMAGFGPGTPLTEALLLDYQDRLRKSGLFDTALVTFDADPARSADATVTVQLRELPLQSATFGVGVSANTGPRMQLEHTHRRIFGYPATLHNKLEYGRDRSAWEGELSTHPGEQLYRNLLGWQVERLKTDLDVVLSQRLRVGRTQDTPRIERLYFLGFDHSLQTVDGTHRDARAFSVQYHGVWRNVDSIILPTRGITLSGQGGVGFALSNYGDNGPFTRAYARVTGYLPLGRSWYTNARLELGEIFKRDSVALPDALAFRAGGDESVRGYPYRSLAPLDTNGVIKGGNVLGTASIEIARPFSQRLPSLWGAVFLDAGRAAESWSGFKPALGYGVGVRWRSPVGPLKLDWAYGEELHKSRLHLSVGIAF